MKEIRSIVSLAAIMAIKGSETDDVLIYVSACMHAKVKVHAEVMPAIGNIHGGKFIIQI